CDGATRALEKQVLRVEKDDKLERKQVFRFADDDNWREQVLASLTITSEDGALGLVHWPARATRMARDPIELEIFKNLYHSVAEEIGAAVRGTAFSPNIRERRDYSFTVFDQRGQVIVMG